LTVIGQTPSAVTFDLLANDALGNPAAVITNFGGGDLGGTVTTYEPGDRLLVFGVVSVSVDATGHLHVLPLFPIDQTLVFNYRIANANGFSDARVTVVIQRTIPDPV
jgi:hypothetical protein